MSEGAETDTVGGAHGEDIFRPSENGGPDERGSKVGAGSQELFRETKDVTEEAAATLRNISTNFLSSLKYKKVRDRNREKLKIENKLP